VDFLFVTYTLVLQTTIKTNWSRKIIIIININYMNNKKKQTKRFAHHNLLLSKNKTVCVTDSFDIFYKPRDRV